MNYTLKIGDIALYLVENTQFIINEIYHEYVMGYQLKNNSEVCCIRKNVELDINNCIIDNSFQKPIWNLIKE